MELCRLAASDLACRRGERVLLRGLELSLAPGEALHVTGANGIGKSSLMRVFAGLLRPLAGTVEREGAVGLLDERPALDPAVSLGKVLAFWRRIDGAGGDHTARLGLDGLMEVPCGYLSTGQRKRAAIARLIGQRAPIWLLDEPLNGLDREGAALLLALVAEHRARGGICVLASHQPLAIEDAQVLALQDYAGADAA